ncbi:unnamed protein product [Spirodela intermedia]|uniref:CID domain-containing protein n=1 Tax=Spirodela intermedia TaxID=51605 RepID=A0A7I8INU3_SPIIN|nr:unnamed protein product [Spirodela intermedia]CAA6658801.1 unnamed protein product [Spirodela intermedia]
MDSDFDEQILADKLSKLSNTQQCIETLSHWCIFHRQKAELVVHTWDKQFHSSQKEQKVPFLYLANDIIQNSRRKGNEFVSEFWKVLPAALKEVLEGGDDRAKSVVSRLVGIWEERRVFGSRTHDLKELMLGNEPPPKLSVGGAAEKIVSAFHAVISERQNEDDELRECQVAVHRVGKMEKDVDIACAQGDAQRVLLAKELQEQESILKQCVEKLLSVEMNRAALVSQLREALHEQESELESVRTQLQVAQAQIDEATNMCRRLNNEPPIPRQANMGILGADKPKKTAAAIAAEIADKLTASSRSQQIMTSVLSSFAAEEAKNANLSSAAGLPNSDGRPIAVSETGFVPAQSLGGTSAHQHQAVLVPQQAMQSQASMPQPQYSVFPNPPQYSVQPSGAVLIGVPYTYSNLPPPPPPVQVMNLARPQLTQQQQQQQQQQQGMAIMQTPAPPPPPPMAMQGSMTLQPALPSYRPLQSSGMAFYQHRSQ